MRSHSGPDGHRACQQCGAELRRERPGNLCDPCSRHPDLAQRLQEAEFFTREPIRRALAAYDFGYLFRAIRRTLELTQTELGEVLGLDQDRISRIERGERQLRDIATIACIATRLAIPPELLGFDPNAATVEKAQTAEIEEVDWVRRRDFSWATAGTILGLSVNGLDIDRLAALLPPDPTGTSSIARIGMADVAAIEEATALLRRLDYSRGGDVTRATTVAQLRSVLPLHNAACTAQLRQRLLVATADLGRAAAWTSYDAGRHDEARRLFLLALSAIQQAEHPQAADLTAYLLTHMADQALHLRQPREVLDLIQLGYGTATRRAQPLSASTASYLASFQAWGQAALGDVQACARALGQSGEHFTHTDPNPATPWAVHLTAAALSAQHGYAHYTLAQATADPKHAATAVPLLQQAVDGRGPAYARGRALNLAALTGAQSLAGDLDTAAHTGHHAVQEITTLASPRAYDRLRTLHTVLQPHNTNPAISEVRNNIHTALTAA